MRKALSFLLQNLKGHVPLVLVVPVSLLNHTMLLTTFLKEIVVESAYRVSCREVFILQNQP